MNIKYKYLWNSSLFFYIVKYGYLYDESLMKV